MRLTWRTTLLQLSEPLRISRSVTANRDAVWVRIEHDGLHGFGEAVASVRLGLSASSIATALETTVRPWLARFAAPESAWEVVAAAAPPGLPAGVLAAVDAALSDLVGKRADRPVHRLLGATRAPSGATARTIGIVDPERAAIQAAELAALGFTVLKIKAGTPDPTDDLNRVAAVHAAAPHARLLLDPNGAWTEAGTRDLLPRFAALGVEAVEQPIPPGRPDLLVRIARHAPIPVIADEDAAGTEDVLRLAGRVPGVNLKLAECGGVRAVLRLVDVLRDSGTEVMLGCLTGSSLSLAPAVQILDRAGRLDLDGHLLLAHDPWTGIGGLDGTVRADPDAAGLGVRPAAWAVVR
ncbi:enolase C-terminal domain-like protein [Embleya scabrispora]|uniref:enolase C-terminal domain-like protein n=1 Tax=Embleya scabrispora TaxID=159449 RepID=UPI000367A22B|nr:enolase C-terminal domain-like protein [Embleya scabrispora]MYS81539.1 dipeptide epimerase [Streptomyces sp. SID5474]